MKHYCTYFDTHYMLRGLTLYRSLQAHAGEFTLWVLCCDDLAFDNLEKLAQPDLKPVRLSEVEAFEPRLMDAKSNRSHVEYLWTLSPIWPLYLLNHDPQIETIVYLDADLFFYASPAPVFEEIGAASISIFSHRHLPEDLYLAGNGIYNVGWCGFRRDETALKCLNKWREQCLEWCYANSDTGLYGDQKYLDEWPELYGDNLCVIEHVGAGIAPWNWTRYRFEQRGDTLFCDGEPLIFFHFHGLRIFNSWLYDTFYTTNTHAMMPARTRRQLFDPYLNAMRATAQWMRKRGAAADFGYVPISKYMVSHGVRTFLKKAARRQLIVYRGLK